MNHKTGCSSRVIIHYTAYHMRSGQRIWFELTNNIFSKIVIITFFFNADFTDYYYFFATPKKIFCIRLLKSWVGRESASIRILRAWPRGRCNMITTSKIRKRCVCSWLRELLRRCCCWGALWSGCINFERALSIN